MQASIRTAPVLLGAMTVFLFAYAITMTPLSAFSAPLRVFHNARIDKDTQFDGDSFRVHTQGTSMVVRLYFADCPETSASHETQIRRVREQTRYFGLSNVVDTLRGGLDAKTFTTHQLKEPFTIHTSHARAGGMSRTPRIYAFVTTSQGQDLAQLLVKAGFARTKGVGRESPIGQPRDETIAQLNDLEGAAMLARRGIWAQSDANRIALMRAQQREDDISWKVFREEAKWGGTRPRSVDANVATQAELERVKGIGPSRAKAIIAHRPYATLTDLERIPGIGKQTLSSLEPPLTVTTDSP